MKIKNPFRKKGIKSFKVQEGVVISKAFECDGIEYFQVHDIFNSFCSRAMDALSLYENWQMRCSRDFLLLHTKAIDDILRDPKKINVIDIADLNNKLKERLQWAMPTEELIWQFMAVAYFDANESIEKYDNKYGQEKIARWKKNNKIDDFFFLTRIKDIVPLPDMSKADLTMLLTMIEKLDKTHLELITGKPLSGQQNKDFSTSSTSGKNTTSMPLN